MPTHRCDFCAINFPPSEQKCAHCERKLRDHPGGFPDKDWKERVSALRADEADSKERQRLEDWELHNLLKLGLEYEEATALARSGISWHEIERVVRKGATPDQAYLIVF